jgi:DNA-binding IclR family transcriptional regulator
MKANGTRLIQSLDRAFDILDVLGQTDTRGLSLKEICATTDLNPSTAHLFWLPALSNVKNE